MKPLTLREMEGAKQRVLANARELVEEAELLLKHRRYPRTYALAHLACEELAKLAMLQRAAVEHAVTGHFNWAKLEKRLRSHSDKIDAMLMHEYLLDPDVEGDADLKRYERAAAFSKTFNQLKNTALYSGVFEGRFRRPGEVIRATLARSAVRHARNRLVWFEAVEKRVRGRIMRMKPEKLKQFLEHSYELIRPLLGDGKAGDGGVGVGSDKSGQDA